MAWKWNYSTYWNDLVKKIYHSCENKDPAEVVYEHTLAFTHSITYLRGSKHGSLVSEIASTVGSKLL